MPPIQTSDPSQALPGRGDARTFSRREGVFRVLKASGPAPLDPGALTGRAEDVRVSLFDGTSAPFEATVEVADPEEMAELLRTLAWCSERGKLPCDLALAVDVRLEDGRIEDARVVALGVDGEDAEP